MGKRLGNKQIGAKTGERLLIADPTAAAELLERIISLDTQTRRVIMFCACPEAFYGGEVECHRAVVADLLLEAAGKCEVRLTVAEWPGDAPVSLEVTASADQERALSKGLTYIPIGPVDGPLPKMAGLGWGSQVHFKFASTIRSFVTGPA